MKIKAVKNVLRKMFECSFIVLACLALFTVTAYASAGDEGTEAGDGGSAMMLDEVRDDSDTVLGELREDRFANDSVSNDSLEPEEAGLKTNLETEDDPILIWRTNQGRGPINSRGRTQFACYKGIDKIQFAYCWRDAGTGQFYYAKGMNTFDVTVNESEGFWHPIEFDTTGLTYGEYYLIADYIYVDGKKIELGVADAEPYVFKILTPDELVGAFVERMYTAVLERDADAGGLNSWTHDLRSGNKDGASLADGFVMSDEFIRRQCDDREYVEILYFAFFGRFPSDSEIDSWVRELQNGKCRAEVLAGFVNSDEFGALCNSFSINQGTYQPKPRAAVSASRMNVNSAGANRGKIAEYVERMYTQALGRASEPSGKEYWINEIISGNQYDAATVAKVGFFESQEYKNKHRSDVEFTKDAYHAFFGREPDEGGYFYWLKMLATGEYDRAGMIETGFGHSTEFKNLLGSYGFVVSE